MSISRFVPVFLLAAAAFAENPLACNLKALSPAEKKHHSELGQKLRATGVERRDLPDGLAIRLPAGVMTFAELAVWVDAERRCCSFLDFHIDVQNGGSMALSMTGRAGAKEAFLAQFDKTK